MGPEVAAVTIGIQDLALKANAGDKAALEDLLSGGRGWIRSLCARKGYFLRSGGDIDDLVQEGLIALHEAVLTWDPSQLRYFVAFAEMVVTRRLATAVKTANRKKHQLLSGAMPLDAPAFEVGYRGHDYRDRLEAWELPDITGLSTDPAELVAAAEDPADTSDLLRVLLAGLSPLERQAMTRVCMSGQSYKTAAAALGIEDKALDNALQRGRGKIIRLAQRSRGLEGLSEEAAFTLRRMAQTQVKEAI
jgi:RNA polymerase sporulation-specific sigma factor